MCSLFYVTGDSDYAEGELNILHRDKLGQSRQLSLSNTARARTEESLWTSCQASGSARKQLLMRTKPSAHALSVGPILFFCFSRVKEGFLLLKEAFLP